MIDKSLQDAYQNLLRENTRLHAEKAQIKDAAEKGLRTATEVIDKLHAVIRNIIADAEEIIVTALPESNERDQIVRYIRQLTPLKLDAEGREVMKK